MKIKLRIPTSLSEITLGEYQKFAVLEGDTEFKAHKMIEIFCGVELRNVLFLTLEQIDDALRLLNNAFVEDPKFVMRTQLDGVKLGFIPNLLDLTFGEYTDLEDNITDWATMHKAMAVLYREVKTEYKGLYSIHEYEGTRHTAEAMKGLPMDIVFGAINFMCRLGMDLSKATLLSMEKEERNNELLNPQNSSSLNDGDGTPSTTPLRRAILLSLSQFQNSITALPTLTLPTTLRSTN